MDKKTKKKIFDGLTGKQRAWLKAFLDNRNKKTFQNKTESARAAKYKCSSDNSFSVIGHRNYELCVDRIGLWMEEVGLSNERLMTKMSELLECKETKHIKFKGAIDEKDLPDGYKLIGISGNLIKNKDGELFGDAFSIIAVDVNDNDAQSRVLNMALKVKGKFANEVVDLNLVNETENKVIVEFVEPDKKKKKS
jgi:hypothetical protein